MRIREKICKRLERWIPIRFQENANKKEEDYKMNEFLKFLRLQIKIYSSIPSQWLQNEMKKKDSYNILFLHVLNFFLKNSWTIKWIEK